VDLTDVTIRGLDDQIYNQFSGEARKRGVSIGELTTQAMAQFLQGNRMPEMDKVQAFRFLSDSFKKEGESLLTIAGPRELTVSRRDLQETGQPIVFFGIQKLVFEDDVTREFLDEFVRSIVGCKIVEFPNGLPKLYIHSKCVNIGEIIIRHQTGEGEKNS